MMLEVVALVAVSLAFPTFQFQTFRPRGTNNITAMAVFKRHCNFNISSKGGAKKLPATLAVAVIMALEQGQGTNQPEEKVANSCTLLRNGIQPRNPRNKHISEMTVDTVLTIPLNC